MATKSILKTIHIKTSEPARALVQALEHAKGKKEQDVIISKTYSEASRTDIKKMFGVHNERI